jgi:hypothetical protein
MTGNKKFIGVQALVIIGILLLAEVFVRLQGHTPGDVRPNWSNFHPVDSLVVYNEFYVDSTGILIANRDYFKTLNIRINSNGFRTAEFNSLDTVKHKIMLIGDSFTWGLSAHPLDSCFADLLHNKFGQSVINTGIPCTDPAQYDAIAKRYIPQIKPDIVFVMFYLGNDIMPVERPIEPYKPFYYYTNAGALMAMDDTTYLGTAKEAYDYYTSRKFYLIHPTGLAEKIISKSALLSRIYSLKYRWQEKCEAENSIRNMSVTKKYLYSIINTCRNNNCTLRFILIPEIKEANHDADFFKRRYTGFFNDSLIAPYTLIPAGNSASNYTPYPDGHFNNAGHKFYAGKMAGYIHAMKGVF